MAEVEVATNIATRPLFNNWEVSVLYILDDRCLGSEEGSEPVLCEVEVVKCTGIQYMYLELIQATARVFNSLWKRANILVS